MSRLQFSCDEDRWEWCTAHDCNLYHAPSDLVGMTVLDVGAGLGAFATLCFELGAKRVACAEADARKAAILRRFLGDFWRRTALHQVTSAAEFDVAAQSLGSVDFCKIDAGDVTYAVCEGSGFPCVKKLVVAFRDGDVDRAQLCRKRFADFGFQETRWEAPHPEFGWMRIYGGSR